MELVQMTLKEYLPLVASDAPAPGGGSASALCGAQGVGLISMVAKLTVSKEKFIEYHPICHSIIKEADEVCEKLMAQIDIDTEAYGKLSAAFKLPKATEEQKADRRAAISRATEYATEVPMETMYLGVQGLKCASRIIGNFNTNCASDVGCGIYEMLACVRGAYLNVLINVDGILDTNRAGYFKRESAALMKYAETLAADLDDKICACI